MGTGKLLIVKALVGKSMHAKFDSSSSSSPSSPSTHFPNKSDYPNNIISVYKNKGDDNKQKQWFLFNHSFLLPEYLVEFEYVPKSV